MRRMVWMMSMPGLPLIGYGGDAMSATIRHDAGASTSPPAFPTSTPASGAAPRTRATSDAGVLPADVVRFRKRRDQCDHLRGEEAGDEARAIELEKKLNRTCRGTDVELAGLRRRYRGNAAVIAALRSCEDRVE